MLFYLEPELFSLQRFRIILHGFLLEKNSIPFAKSKEPTLTVRSRNQEDTTWAFDVRSTTQSQQVWLQDNARLEKLLPAIMIIHYEDGKLRTEFSF